MGEPLNIFDPSAITLIRDDTLPARTWIVSADLHADILKAFGVPAKDIGKTEGSTYAEAKAASDAFLKRLREFGWGP